MVLKTEILNEATKHHTRSLIKYVFLLFNIKVK